MSFFIKKEFPTANRAKATSVIAFPVF